MATTFDLGPTSHLSEGPQGPDRIQEWRHEVYDVFRVEPNTADTMDGTLAIPLDGPMPLRTRRLLFAPVIDSDDEDVDKPRCKVKRRTSSRDSQRRRDALLIGKEGSRQRRRWENGKLSIHAVHRLMHVPNAQPPLPSDWEVHPTHTVHYDLPYHVAQFWDCGMREMINERRAAQAVLRRQQDVAHQSQTPAPGREKNAKKGLKKSPKKNPKSPRKSSVKAKANENTPDSASVSPSPTFGMVTRDLRVAVKKSETIKLWVRALEEPVRQYVFAAEAARRASDGALMQKSEAAATEISPPSSDLDDNDDDGSIIIPSDASAASATYAVSDQDDDELVFVGRRSLVDKEAQASWKHAHREVNQVPVDSGILFDSLGDGETGSFKRWIAHSLSEYYGLTSQSTNTNGSNRVVYVSLREEAMRAGAGPILIPRPMWELFEAC
ncbi:hypothetical protein SEPCBS119000_005886 [Sporothrix epigloea]|uniref:R3H-associated N-terminal domain-containing protein n=1 Tax=Sporothrix epigloea TaxID=1892477 RepID=A0ABP0E173_9PEZI